MSVEVVINIKDGASPEVRRLVAASDPHILATRIAPPLARHWRDHLAALPKNKRGFPSTGFWEDAARRVRGIAVGNSLVLQSDKLGLRQRLKGGTIRALNVKNLAIPLTAEAYGTKPADWGDTLTLVILGDGRKFLCLYNATGTQAYSSSIGKFQSQFNKRKSEGKIQTRAAERSTSAVRQFASSIGGEDHPRVIMFRRSSGGRTKARAERYGDLKFLFKLQPSVEQDANPNVIPQDISDVAREEVIKALSV